MIAYEFVDIDGKTVGIDNLDDNLDILGPDAISVVDRGTKVMKVVKQEPTVKDTPITRDIANHGLRDCGFRNVNQEDVDFLAGFTRFGLKAYVGSIAGNPAEMFGNVRSKYAYYLNDWFGMQSVEWERKEVVVDSGTVKDAEVYVGEVLLANGHYFVSNCGYAAPLTDAVGYWRWTD
jgi:hypothetical protein